MAHRNDQDRIEKTCNVPRFFVEHPQVSWVLLVGVLVWGWFGYHSMPQRKDPDIPVRVAVASCSWPGATAQQVEQFITRPIEDAVAENKTIHPGTAADYGIRSVSIPGYAYVQLAEDVSDVKRQFSDINLKLDALNGQLPQGAGPISFESDFGDTAALMLTIASPKADSIEIDIRARGIQSSIQSARAARKYEGKSAPVAIVYSFPQSLSSNKTILDAAQLFEQPGRTSGNPSGAPLNPGKRIYRCRRRIDCRRRVDPLLHSDFFSDAVAAIRIASRRLGTNHHPRSSGNARATGRGRGG
jgi:hypothetical protein